MARTLSISLAGLLCLLAASCSRQAEAETDSILVYCTPDAVPYARMLKRLAEEGGEQRQITLAPMRPGDVLAAVEGTRAGDFVVCIGRGLEGKLAKRDLVRMPPVTHGLGVCLVSAKAMEVADLGLSDTRLGSGKPGGPLADAADQAVPQALRAAVSANIVHRSARSDQLVRLVKLGSLDAAFVWSSPPPASDLPTLPLPRQAGSRPLRIVALSCSRLAEAQTKAMLDVWQSPVAVQALAEDTGKAEGAAK